MDQRPPAAVRSQRSFLPFDERRWKNLEKRPITGESRTGAVEEFWFDSRSHGMLTIDRVRPAENGFRYELWESMTGGDSWSVRQVDSNRSVLAPGP